MRIAIAGGTGTVGTYIVAHLEQRGHEVRVLSRRSADFPVDLTTGVGLAAALADCQVVVDASNAQAAKAAQATLVEGTRRLLDAEEKAGVGHHVCVSIVGCSDVPYGYYKIKTEQERIVEQGPVPWTIARATQFHELVDMIFAKAAGYRILPSVAIPMQTIAADEAGAAIADVAEHDPQNGRITIAGPQVRSAKDLAKTWKRATGRGALSLPIPLPGATGRALRSGGLTMRGRQPNFTGTVTFDEWLRKRS